MRRTRFSLAASNRCSTLNLRRNIMKLVSALVGLAALSGVALSSGAASAQESTTVNVPAGYVCNEYGHCWHRHNWGGGGGYYHPHYWGGYGGWHRHWAGYGGGYGGGYGWHRHWGGWGGGYGWHRWHQW
jgi:hypothetical protein